MWGRQAGASDRVAMAGEDWCLKAARMGEVRGLGNPRLQKWAGARPPRALQTLKAKVFSLYASRQTCLCHTPSAYARLSPQSPSQTQTSLCLCLLPKKPAILKPALPSQNAIPLRVSSRQSISTKENNTAERATRSGSLLHGQVLVQVFLQLWSPDDSIQPTGQSLGSCTLWATQGTTHLGRLGWGSEISTWTSDLGEHMTSREFWSIRLF